MLRENPVHMRDASLATALASILVALACVMCSPLAAYADEAAADSGASAEASADDDKALPDAAEPSLEGDTIGSEASVADDAANAAEVDENGAGEATADEDATAAEGENAGETEDGIASAGEAGSAVAENEAAAADDDAAASVEPKADANDEPGQAEPDGASQASGEVAANDADPAAQGQPDSEAPAPGSAAQGQADVAAPAPGSAAQGQTDSTSQQAPQDDASTEAAAVPGTAATPAAPQVAVATTQSAKEATGKIGSSASVSAKADASKADSKAGSTAKSTAANTALTTQSTKKTQAAKPSAKVSLRAHVQDIGDQSWVTAGVGSKNKATAGTSGKGLRMESLRITLDSSVSGSIQYQVHVQDVGWQTLRKDGTIAGTSGKSLRLEAVRIALTGDVSRYYNIKYRVHVQNLGWQDWKQNGALAGTSGQGLRLEAIQVYLAKKEKTSKKPADGIVGVVYQGKVEGQSGFQANMANGQTAGTTGSGQRLESLRIWLNSGGYKGALEYKARVQGKGWTSWLSAGSSAGAIGQGLRIDALKVRLTGDIADSYDVQYRAHVQNVGWQPWALDGGTAGTTGKGLQIEAVQVKLVKKAKAATSVADGTYAVALASNAGLEMGASGSAVSKRDYSATDASGKFYVRNEKGGVTLQSVSTGKFLTGKSGVSLSKWSGKTAQVWTLSWNGGLRLTNKASGKALTFKDNAGVLGSKGAGMTFYPLNLVNDGDYIVTNAAQGNVLDVDGASWSSGANITVHTANNGGNQVFTFSNNGDGWCTVVNTMTKMGVDVANGSRASGANVRQYTANGTSAQQWKPCLERDGKLYFVNRASGNALTAAGSGASGANVVSGTYNSKDTQKWTLSPGSWSFTGNSALDEFVLSVAAANDRDLRSCFDWMSSLQHVQSVDDRIQYGIFSDSTLNSYAVHAMNRGVADCYTDASMFCWLARACGYSANARGGGCPSASRGTVPHGWTEVYVDGVTYVCDSNLRRDIPGADWFMKTYDSTPVAYTIW